MKAMVLRRVCEALVPEERPVPEPGPGQVLVRVCACAVCRTDLHVVDGELPDIRPPIVPGHEIIGRVARVGAGVERFRDRRARRRAMARLDLRGVRILPQRAREPVPERRASPATRSTAALPNTRSPTRATASPFPTLLRRRGGAADVRGADRPPDAAHGGRGAAARPLRLRRGGAYRRPGGALGGRRGVRLHPAGRRDGAGFRPRLGAVWAGGSDEAPPEPLDAALIFAPVGALVPAALRAVAPGGVVVCGGIHMSDIPSFPYSLLWMERRSARWPT